MQVEHGSDSFDPEKFKKLLDENNKKPVKRVKPVKVAMLPERPTKDRLKEYNRVLAKRHRTQKIHDTMFDIIAILSFLMVIYLVVK